MTTMTTITSATTGAQVTIPTLKTATIADRVREYQKANPKATGKEVAAALGILPARVHTINCLDRAKAKKLRAKRKAARAWAIAAVGTSNKPVSQGLTYGKNTEADPVNHPAHYKVGGVETIDFIEAKGLNYNLGNVVKYITRAEFKGNTVEDLQKARWYLNREIAAVTKAGRGAK